MPAARGSAFPTAHRVVDRIHGDSPHLGPATTPSGCTCFSERDILMVGVPNLAHGGTAQDKDLPNLARRHPDLSIAAFLGHKLGCTSSASNQLASSTRCQFQVVDRGSQRNVNQRKIVPGNDVCFGPGNDRVSWLHARSGENVPLLSVGIMETSYPGTAIWIVLDESNLRRDAILVATEVNDSISSLVASTPASNRDSPRIAAATDALLPTRELPQRLHIGQIVPGVHSTKASAPGMSACNL